MTTRRVVVVGAGHAGGTFVALLRQTGFTGEVLVLGAEPHLPYHRPPLSKRFLDDTPGDGTPGQGLRDPAFYTEQRLTMALDETVVALDRVARTVTTSRGRVLPYDTLVLATGARPRELTIPESALDGVLTLRTVEDAARLRGAVAGGGPLAIVGGGYVGLEVAAVARSVGIPVTVLEREDRLLARVASPTLSGILADHHRARGTAVKTGAQVVAFEGDAGRLRRLLTSDGSVVDAATALVGVGAVPCDELAAAAGLRCAALGGVLVDERARTSDPSVLAIGDLTVRSGWTGSPMRLESIPSAVEQARQAVATVCGTTPPASEVPWFWSDQFELKLKIAGVVLPPFATVVRGEPASGSFALFHHHGDRLVAVETANANADFMAGKRLLAAARPLDPDRLADPAVPLRELALA